MFEGARLFGLRHVVDTDIAFGGVPVDGSRVAEVLRTQVPEASIEVSPGLTDLERRDIRTRGRLSIERARRELGFVPRYDLPAGIAAYVRTLRAFQYACST